MRSIAAVALSGVAPSGMAHSYVAQSGGAEAFQPGIYTIAVIAVLLAIAVWMAKRERDRRDRIGAGLPPDAWSIPCLDATTAGTKRLMVVSDAGLALAETRSGSRESWPWDEIGSVVEKQIRVRVQTYQGLRISFVDGHQRDLLVYSGTGKDAYRLGSMQARERINAHLPDRPDI